MEAAVYAGDGDRTSVRETGDRAVTYGSQIRGELWPSVIRPTIHHIIRIDDIIHDLKDYHISFFKQNKSIGILGNIFP